VTISEVERSSFVFDLMKHFDEFIRHVRWWNGFNGIVGPRPADFPAFETDNAAFQATVDTKSAWVSVPALNLNANMVTMTAWINPNVDSITPYAAIFYSRRGSADPGGVGIQFTSENQIGYTWNDGNEQTWAFLSGLRPPANQWSFVAVVIEPTKATLYLYNASGQFSTNNAIPHTSEAWDGSALIGADPNHLDRLFDGIMVPMHAENERGRSMNHSSQIRMTNDEIRRNDEIQMTKPANTRLSLSTLGLRISFVIRHSSFDDLSFLLATELVLLSASARARGVAIHRRP
jgi:hypothetical protein